MAGPIPGHHGISRATPPTTMILPTRHLPALFPLLLLTLSCAQEDTPVAEAPPSEPEGVGPTWAYGGEPGLAIEKVEDHCDALLYWLERGYRNRRVLHVDTHDDSRLTSDENVRKIEQLVGAGDYEELARLSGVSFSSTPKAFDIGNFLYTGWKLGVVREVCWIIPGYPHQIEDIGRVRSWLQAIGFDAASANSFRIVDGEIRGNRSGMPMVICTAGNIPHCDEPTLLSLDIDYLVGHYDDPDTTPMRDEVLKLHRAIQESGLRTDFVLISFSVHGGSITLEHKYAGDYFERLIGDPSARESPPAFWKSRVDGLRSRAMGKFDEAASHIEEALRLIPGDAGLLFDLARVRLEDGDVEGACATIGRAVEQDPSYFIGYVELAWTVLNDPAFASSDRGAVSDRLLQAAAEVFPAASGAESHAMLGAGFLRRGEFRRAQIEYFQLMRKAVPAQRLHVFQN